MADPAPAEHPDAGPALAVEDLTVVLNDGRREVRALDGVSLRVELGEVVALVGESGSGKSVLGSTVQALLPESARPRVSGSVLVAGVEMVGCTDRVAREVRRKQLGVVFQDPMSSLNPTMLVRKQVAEAAGDKVRVAELLGLVGLGAIADRPRAYPHELSGGQRQRVMMAMAVARRPRLVIADEPTTALDVTVQAQILDLVTDLRDRTGCAFLFITHDLGVAAQIADRVVVMRRGKVVETGECRQVLRAPAHEYTQALLASRITLTTPREQPLQVGSWVGTSWPPPAPVEAAQPVLFLQSVSHRFRKSDAAPALDDISFELSAGRSLAIVGESGSGKSTLLRVIAGLIHPTEGAVRRDGDTQMVFQDAAASLTPWLTVRTLLEERLRAAAVARSDWSRAIADVTSRVGLEPESLDSRPRSLSGGQAQRAAVARAMIRPPLLLLADEPTSALDVSLAANVLNLLTKLRRELGIGLVFVTHDLAAARFVADDVIVLRAGRIVETGKADDVLTNPTDPYTAALLAALPDIGTGRAAS